LFRLACKYAPLYVVLTVVDGVVWGINNSIELYYTKILFDMIGNGTPFLKVLNLIILMAVYNLLLFAYHYWYMKYKMPMIQKDLQYRLHTELFEKARSLDLSCYDDPEFYNDFIWSINESDTRVQK
jgi:ATP-binding cassette subfamily B protein